MWFTTVAGCIVITWVPSASRESLFRSQGINLDQPNRSKRETIPGLKGRWVTWIYNWSELTRDVRLCNGLYLIPTNPSSVNWILARILSRWAAQRRTRASLGRMRSMFFFYCEWSRRQIESTTNHSSSLHWNGYGMLKPNFDCSEMGGQELFKQFRPKNCFWFKMSSDLAGWLSNSLNPSDWGLLWGWRNIPGWIK